MAELELPSERQPDATPPHAPVHAPSMFVYGSLVAIAAALISVAFTIKVDWGGLFLNLAASLIAAVVILVFVDQRLRSSEVQMIRGFPRQLGFRSLIFVSPRHRQLYRYNRLHLSTLRALLRDKVRPSSLQDLEHLLKDNEKGFILLGKAGCGKTTRLQMLTAQMAQEFFENPTKRVPILYPLRRWLPDRSLSEALLEYVNGFAPVSRRSFRHTLNNGRAVVLLDGADELPWDSPLNLSTALSALRSTYPAVTWIISSRPDRPNTADDLPSINLTPLTSDEMHELVRRLRH